MSQMQALIGEKLGSYRIESVLGSGAMGVVYRGTDEKRGRPATIKVVSGEIARGGKVQKRFEREAEILQQFRHPNIVRFLAWGKFRGTWYIAMEFIQGVTLEKLIQDGGPIGWREVVDLAIQVCDALHYAHERGVVHRDLKPSNLMITEDRRVKLTDFGIAKDLDRTSLTATGRTLGTAAYMAPEQIRGTPAVSHKTDLYALGAVLYQMLVGRAPFEGSSPVVLMHCHLNEPAPRPSAKVHEIPRALDDLVVGLMAKTPADRPWDAAAVGVVLTELRDKAARGESIPMVWPTSGTGAANPPRAGGVPDGATGTTRPRKKTRKSTILSTLTGSFLTTRSRAAREGADAPERSRAGLETLLLLAALLGIGGLILYLVWPPGQEYLYKHAEALMASSRYSDWVMARDEYLEPLDRRFPTNPYREQTTKWRDKILLADAERRVEYLTAPVQTSFSKPTNHAESLFVIAHTAATVASGHGNDPAAVERWKEMAGKLNPDDPEERKWYLMALHRAEQLDRTISDRRKLVEEQIRLADELRQAGRTEAAMAIFNKLREQYKDYTDLADLFAALPAQPAAGPSTSGPPGSPAGSSPPAPEGAAPEKPKEGPGKAEAPPAAPSPGPAGSGGQAAPTTPDPPAGPGPAGADTPTPPESVQPRLSREVNQQFDSELRRIDWTPIDRRSFVR
jgi:serine/threonine-protein kinase